MKLMLGQLVVILLLSAALIGVIKYKSASGSDAPVTAAPSWSQPQNIKIEGAPPVVETPKTQPQVNPGTMAPPSLPSVDEEFQPPIQQQQPTPQRRVIFRQSGNCPGGGCPVPQGW
jgi:hypothetical protein